MSEAAVIGGLSTPGRDRTPAETDARRRLSKQRVGQFGEAVDDEIAGRVRVWVGRAGRTPLVGPAHKGGAVAFTAGGVEIEIVAGDHQDFIGPEGEVRGGASIGLRPWLVYPE